MTYLNKSNYLKFLGIIFIVLISIKPAFALVISEIHPKPTPVDGEQKGREWVEVFNDSTDAIDLTEYVLSESKGDRTISANGDKILQSGEYAIIGQDYTKFKADPTNSSFNGKFFTAAFTALTDSGEELIIKKNNQEVCGLKTYSSVTVYDQSVHFTSLGLVKGTATSGTGNLVVGQTYSQLTGVEISNNATTTSATSSEVVETYVAPTYYNRYYFPESEKIYVNAGENRLGVVGADMFFEAKAVTGDKKSVNANFFWSFGDGEISEGSKVYHTFKFPGEYIVDVEGYANNNKNNTRIYIKIVEPDLKIKLGQTKNDRYVEIFNKSKDEIDVGGFLVNNSQLPKKLSILPNKSIKISEQTLKFATGTTKVVLQFSTGKEITNDEIFLTTKEKEEREKINKVNTTSLSQVSVYTKENFDKLQKTTENVVIKKAIKKYIKSNLTTKPQTVNVITPVEYTNEKFVVKNEDKNIIQSMLNYFGI